MQDKITDCEGNDEANKTLMQTNRCRADEHVEPLLQLEDKDTHSPWPHPTAPVFAMQETGIPGQGKVR